jgi:CubicO group peptidase (beta-lactamase class C family)
MAMLAQGGSLAGVRLLAPATVTALTTNVLTGPLFPVRFFGNPNPGLGYGLGVGIYGEMPRFGWIGISGTTAWIYPEDELVAIAMPQSLFDWSASDTLLGLAPEARSMG